MFSFTYVLAQSYAVALRTLRPITKSIWRTAVAILATIYAMDVLLSTMPNEGLWAVGKLLVLIIGNCGFLLLAKGLGDTLTDRSPR